MISRFGILIVVYHLILIYAGKLDFYQDEYDIKMDRAECSWYNKSCYKYVNASFTLYNRTQRVFNMFSDLLVDVGSGFNVDIQVYKFTSNEYRFFPITVHIHACTEIRRNTFGWNDMFAETSNIDFCNLTKGSYYVKNAIPDFSKFPPHLPKGMYKVVAMFKMDCVNFVQLDFYGTLKDKPDYWRKLI